MKKTLFSVALLATLLVNGAYAQDRKAAKKEVVTEAKATVAADKEELKDLKASRTADKERGDRAALKADRKRTFRTDKKLLKDQVKKDVDVVKEKL